MPDDKNLLALALVIAVLTVATLVALAWGLPEDPDCRPAGHTVGCER